ncbi:MAG: hypothetical protein M3Y21_09475 [Candidatus Eremiobacteraeota bacterium]|nr:hypothetical protein [Candidatus Eremiobacteraeota bacterium]
MISCAVPATADTTSVGITINGTSGAHIESQQSETIPFVPLPMLEIEHRHKRLRLRAEIVPPVGPLPLAQSSNGFELGQQPQVSYLTGEATYSFMHGRFEFGIGETVINQRTFYPPSPVVQASRVVGARYLVRSRLYSSGHSRLEASLAVSPSMHAVQYTMFPAQTGFGPGGKPTAFPAFTANDPERASTVDAALRWSVQRRRFTLSYGLRYINYAAAYSSSGRLADRNHLLMPFVGVAWNLPHKPSRAVAMTAQPSVAVAPQTHQAPDASTTSQLVRNDTSELGVSLYGTNGTSSFDAGHYTTPASFAVLPVFQIAHTRRRFTLAAQGALPRANANLFGSPIFTWSYLNTDLLYASANRRNVYGVGESIVSERFAHADRNVTTISSTRLEGLNISARMRLLSNGHGSLLASIRVSPYLHDASFFTDEFSPSPGCRHCFSGSHTSRYIRHGSRIDGSLGWSIPHGRYTFSYGLRYINQTIYDGKITGNRGQPDLIFLERTSSLMPFIGVALPGI